MEKYRLNLDLWKKEQQRQFEEFLIEEPELEERLVIFIKENNVDKFYNILN